MRSVAILLVNLGFALESGVAAECRRRGFASVTSVDDLPAPGSRRTFGLCLVAVRGSGDVEYRRVEVLLQKIGDTPLVVLADRVGPELAFRFRAMGVTDLIALPVSYRAIGARTLSHFAENGETRLRGDLVGRSEAMRELGTRSTAAAQVRSTVLIQGETGVGKGVFARAIHDRSPFAAEPFVHVDCAALSPSLIESELFGHEKGAFTGADAVRRGRCELVGRGTLFLDEIGDLDAALQSKLLRVLENRTFERVGGSKTLFMQARVIAATSKDLIEDVRAGRFRQDLYYRLNVLSLSIPPLRERAEDLPDLVQIGLRRLHQRIGVRPPAIADDFYDRLRDHDWPGNVRELMNVLERILVERPVTSLESRDLDAVLSRTPSRGPEPEVSGLAADEDLEIAAIAEALVETGGNISRAARRLNLPRGTLRYKISKKKLGHLIPRD